MVATLSFSLYSRSSSTRKGKLGVGVEVETGLGVFVEVGVGWTNTPTGAQAERKTTKQNNRTTLSFIDLSPPNSREKKK